jgi:hypothetical protein
MEPTDPKVAKLLSSVIKIENEFKHFSKLSEDQEKIIAKRIIDLIEGLINED